MPLIIKPIMPAAYDQPNCINQRGHWPMTMIMTQWPRSNVSIANVAANDQWQDGVLILNDLINNQYDRW